MSREIVMPPLGIHKASIGAFIEGRQPKEGQRNKHNEK